MKADELRNELNEFLTFVHQKDLGVMSKKEIIDNYLTESKVNELNKSDVMLSLPSDLKEEWEKIEHDCFMNCQRKLSDNGNMRKAIFRWLKENYELPSKRGNGA